MKEIFNNKMTPSEFLNGWFTNDYLSSFPREKTDLEKYYRGYINGRFLRHTQHYYDQNLNPILKIIKDQHPKQLRVLEVGSGCGTESLYLALFGCKTVSVELLKKYHNVAIARKNVIENNLNLKLDVEFIHTSILKFEDIDKFDLIWMEQAFHHMEPRNLVVEKISSLLKPGGYLILSESNAYNLISQIFLMRERYRTHGNPFKTVIEQTDDDGKVHLWGHERILSPFKLANLFARKKIIKHSVDYYKILPNRMKIKVTKDDFINFYDNDFTLWLAKFLNSYLPVFIKRFIVFSYNYVGIKE